MAEALHSEIVSLKAALVALYRPADLIEVRVS
jgi:hypothetical protein